MMRELFTLIISLQNTALQYNSYTVGPTVLIYYFIDSILPAV